MHINNGQLCKREREREELSLTLLCIWNITRQQALPNALNIPPVQQCAMIHVMQICSSWFLIILFRVGCCVTCTDLLPVFSVPSVFIMNHPGVMLLTDLLPQKAVTQVTNTEINCPVVTSSFL